MQYFWNVKLTEIKTSSVIWELEEQSLISSFSYAKTVIKTSLLT